MATSFDLTITGAREHNLKNISLTLPKGKLIVFTGPSGSGKTSLAFDTLYAEGQRRYVESLSAYARQFLEMMPKPDVDSIEGLSPAISIEQKTTSRNPRSTVGTVTEIYDYLRLLFARVGTAYSPTTGLPIEAQTRTRMMETILASIPKESRFYLMAPIARGEKGEFRKELRDLEKQGYQRVKIDGHLYEVAEAPLLEKNKKHTIHVIIDRLVHDESTDLQDRILSGLETALGLAKGLAVVEPVEDGAPLVLSANFVCPVSGFTLEEIEPRLFSFNNPFGACRQCNGLGIRWGSWLKQEDIEDISLDDLPVCEACQGYRLKSEALCVKIAGNHIGEICEFPLDELARWSSTLDTHLQEHQRIIAQRILKEINSRLTFLLEVGLSYLTLSRKSGTLSGGESQRIRLASQVGSGLTGVLYVLDEPSIGLHQRDNEKLLRTLMKLRDLDNTVLVVEHDEDAIRCADHIVDFGPGAGRYGGAICAQGTLSDILNSHTSLTGAYLRREKSIPVPTHRRVGSGQQLCVRGAKAHNLQNITVDFPLGALICVTGVSGSGKSSLVMDTLCPWITAIKNQNPLPSSCESVHGVDFIDKLISIDQSPIGRTPRSNPATYTGVFTPIREWFSWLPEAKARGYSPGRFSFNVKGGRCEACQGDGVLTIEMHFLPNMYVPCDSCKGKRYSRDTLEITYNGKSISDVLEMTIAEAADFFQAIPSISQKFQTLMSVGLGYLQVGQSAPTLSGGEAQRVKLAKELSKRATGKTLYILDEPTTGLHFQDVQQLLDVLHRLVEQGNTMVIIEHNLEVIKTADWIIDIGPEGGKKGGAIVGMGTPEYIASLPESYTGQFLAPLLSQAPSIQA
jgi:excinuclease ABC subunit A